MARRLREFELDALIGALRSAARGAQAHADRRPSRIAELSMEFDCELREVRSRDSPDAARRVVVFHAPDLLRRNRHRIKVTIFGQDGLRAEVRRDGALLEDIASESER